MKASWSIADDSGKVVGEVPVNEPKLYFLTSAEEEPMMVAEPELAYGKIKPMIQYLGYCQQEVAAVLEVDPSTLFRWNREDKLMGKLRSKTMTTLTKSFRRE